MEVLSRKREGKRLYARAQKWSCQTCLFLDSRKPTFELLRNCFSLPSESKNGHACRKNGCPPRVHFQATNVNAISVPSGRIVRRPTRIDTSMQSVDACCTASNNSRKLPVTVRLFYFVFVHILSSSLNASFSFVSLGRRFSRGKLKTRNRKKTKFEK